MFDTANVSIFAGSSGQVFAERMCAYMGKTLGSSEVIKFSEGLRGYVTYILPLIIAGVYLKGYWDFFAGRRLVVRLSWMAVAVAFLVLVAWLVFSGKREKNEV